MPKNKSNWVRKQSNKNNNTYLIYKFNLIKMILNIKENWQMLKKIIKKCWLKQNKFWKINLNNRKKSLNSKYLYNKFRIKETSFKQIRNLLIKEISIMLRHKN